MADNYLITGYWGEPHVTAENDRGINAGIFGAGRFVLPVGEQFKAEYIGNNTVRMYDGKLMDNGAAAGIPAGEYVDFQIPNAGQGMKRNDLIIFQYSQDASTLIEKGEFVVVRGTETDEAATDPELTQSDLLSGAATFDQMALWRICVSGTDIADPVQLFDVSAGLSHKAPAGLIEKRYDVNTGDDLAAAIDDAWNCTAGWSEGHFIFNMRASVGQIYGGVWHITTYKTNDEYGVIKAVGYNGSHPTVMYCNKMQTWAEWEWENPPMTVGAEFRTIERYEGKPVYIRLFDIGTLPNGTAKSVKHNIANIKHIVDFGGSMDNGNLSSSLPFHRGTANLNVFLGIDDTYINTRTGDSTFTDYNAYVWFKYTKTTD